MKRVVVTGLGIVSSIGNNAEEVTASLKAGTSGIEASTEMAEHGFRSQVAGTIKLNVADHIDKRTLRFMGQGAAYAYLAMEQAIADAPAMKRPKLRRSTLRRLTSIPTHKIRHEHRDEEADDEEGEAGPSGRASQDPGSVGLGNWDKWEDGVMTFSGGSHCWATGTGRKATPPAPPLPSACAAKPPTAPRPTLTPPHPPPPRPPAPSPPPGARLGAVRRGQRRPLRRRAGGLHLRAGVRHACGVRRVDARCRARGGGLAATASGRGGGRGGGGEGAR